MRDFLMPVFQLYTGLAFFIFLIVALSSRAKLIARGPRLALISLLFMPLGFFLMSSAGAKSSLGSATPLLISGGGVFVLSMVLLSLGLYLMARDMPSVEGNS